MSAHLAVEHVMGCSDRPGIGAPPKINARKRYATTLWSSCLLALATNMCRYQSSHTRSKSRSYQALGRKERGRVGPDVAWDLRWWWRPVEGLELVGFAHAV